MDEKYVGREKMENKFCLLNCRFHKKNKRKLLIQGYFEQNELQGCRPVITLDYHVLEYEILSRTVLNNPLEYMEYGRPTKRYFFVVNLPEDYQKYKELRCFQYEGAEIEELFYLSTKWLVKKEQEEEFHIDESIWVDKGFRICGWCTCTGDAKLYLSNKEDGKTSLPVHVKKMRRMDAENECPDCASEDVFGFEIRGHVDCKTVWCILEDDVGIHVHKVSIHNADIVRKQKQCKTMFRKIQVYYQQFGGTKTMLRAWEKATKKETSTYQEWRWKHCPTKRDLTQQIRYHFAYEPSYGIVVPLYKTPARFLEEMVRSVREQTYSNWVLYLSDGSGKDSPILPRILKFAREDKRIRVIDNKQMLRIVDNTNAALNEVKEDYIVFMDHDDMLAPDSLYECTRVLNQDRDTDIIYTDEDKVTMDGKTYYQPHFKSDFNLDLLRSANYMCHLFVVKKKLLDEVGFLRGEYEGSQDYDFILRCVEKTKKIAHISKVLYHWRVHMDSTAGNPGSKEYAYFAGKKAIEEHYRRVGLNADVERLNYGFYRTRYKLTDNPLVSVIIANKDHAKDLECCISSIAEKTSYKNLEYVIIENNSVQSETFTCYEILKHNYENVKVLEWSHEFNYSAINNFAVSQAKGEYLLFLNNDTEMINDDCIEEMLTFCMREGTGVVGARLFYPNGAVQHAGVIVGLGGIAGHAFTGASHEELGYFARVICAQEYSAVTGACMMVKREAFKAVGGFDKAFAVAFNDVDFCLQIQKVGYKVVYNPFAMMYHYESKTRENDEDDESKQRFQNECDLFASRWQEILKKGDPYYNPNLTLVRSDFSLKV